MNRGSYSSFAEHKEYKSANKKWVVELERYHKYWYDLIVHPDEVAEYFDTRKLIVNYLKQLKITIEENLDKRFVYFICSREKVRFNLKKKSSYNPFTKKVKIHILVGREQKKRSIKSKFYDRGLKRLSKPKIQLTDKYITLTDSNGDLTTASIHDFLEQSEIDLGISSNVEYVGYTENPHTRPTNGSHTGLSDTLYKVSNENCDTLIYFNIFRVITDGLNQNSMINFAIPNSMTDEIGADDEGKIIEKCFLFYFDAFNQSRNKKNELSELKNNLINLAENNNINSVSFYYEFEDVNDYGTFSSTKVKPNHSHRFSVSIKNNDVEISRE